LYQMEKNWKYFFWNQERDKDIFSLHFYSI
jgi:hypothetical protein